VGAAVPATLDQDGRVVTWPSRPDWVGFPLLRFLEETFPGAVVRFADDGNLAALAEARESGYADLAYLGVGTGIGGGLVVGGRVRPRLADGCEIGHMVVDLGGEVCTCGRRGCVQSVASGPATLRRAELSLGCTVSVNELADGFAYGEDWAVMTVTQSARALAAAVVNLGELLRIGMVRIGGGFASSLKCLIPAVVAEAAALGRPGHPLADIQAAVLGPNSSLYGALLLAGIE
jgi:kanosamine 6-kinase